MKYLTSTTELTSRSQKLVIAISNLTRIIKTEKRIRITSDDILFSINNLIVNEVFKVTDEESEKNKLITEIILLISGTNIDDLTKMREKYNISTCVEYIKNILFYDTLCLLTKTLFDDDGCIKAFFIDFIEQFIELPDDFKMAILIVDSSQYNTFYRIIINSIIFICLDPKLTYLSIEQRSLHQTQTQSLFQTSSKSKEIEKQKAQLVDIAKASHELRKKVLGTAEQPIKLTVKEQINFICCYLNLNDLLIRLHTDTYLRSTLHPDKAIQIYHLAIYSPILPIWKKASKVLEDEDIQQAYAKNPTLKKLYQEISTARKTLSRFEHIVPQGRHAAFFSVFNKSY